MLRKLSYGLQRRLSVIGNFRQGVKCDCKFYGIPLSSTAHEPREVLDYDVVIVGAGPAGLSAAIKLKQLCQSHNSNEISICIVEKGAEVGAHIISGNILETRALDELIPKWYERGAPVKTKVIEDSVLFLTEDSSTVFPKSTIPPSISNTGKYVVSLSQLTRWLALQAEELGVEIYPGFAASEVLYNEGGCCIGIATKDTGIAKDGSRKDTFTRGIELRAKQTLFAEGARGSCSEKVIEKFNLRDGSRNQTFAIGLKEVWQVPEEIRNPGLVQHMMGWPLQSGYFDKTYGGSFLYHMDPDLVLIGLVIGLDYRNPYLNPYKEFQKLKKHPDVKKHLVHGTCIEYGARALNEGGFYALPSRLAFPGGALIGCAAGTLNTAKLKGTHTAMKSGMVAAEAIFDLFTKSDDRNTVTLDFDNRFKNSWVYSELQEFKNCRASFHYGLLPGMIYSGLSANLFKGREPWTLKGSTKRDSEATDNASRHKEILYEKADGEITFDLLTNLQRSSVNHEHDQPSHLKIKDGLEDVPVQESLNKYAGPESRFCPAGVYEFEDAGDSTASKLIINAQNCIHCKTCSIKTPHEYIEWTVPEGGGGPNYTMM